MNFIVLTLFILYCKVLSSNGKNSLELSYIENSEGVEYLTYTKNNSQNSVNIRYVDFNDDYLNVFIIHGFDVKSLDEPLQVKDDLFKYVENVRRVIIIDWQDYSEKTGKFERLI